MKRFTLYSSYLLLSLFMVACNRNANEKTEATVAENNTEQAIDDKENNNTKVAFLIYPEIAILDMTGPMDAFIKINRMTENQYDVYTVSATTDVIKTQGHIVEIKAEYTFENAPVPDILIIPGAKLDVVQKLG